MKRLIETFLAEDQTGNQYRIDCFQIQTKINNKIVASEIFYQHKGNEASPMEDDLYYLVSLDTEVKRITPT